MSLKEATENVAWKQFAKFSQKSKQPQHQIQKGEEIRGHITSRQ